MQVSVFVTTVRSFISLNGKTIELIVLIRSFNKFSVMKKLLIVLMETQLELNETSTRLCSSQCLCHVSFDLIFENFSCHSIKYKNSIRLNDILRTKHSSDRNIRKEEPKIVKSIFSNHFCFFFSLDAHLTSNYIFGSMNRRCT